MQCPKCNWQNQENAHYCANCATELIKRPPFYKRHKVLTVLGSLLLAACVFAVIGIVRFVSDVSNEIDQETQKESVISGSGPDSIALINIDGVIVENDPTDTFSSFSEEYTSARNIKKTLQDVAEDDSVKAILLRVNSPGGSAAASEEILSDINSFKAEHTMPVVAYFTDVAASGGYYVSMSADRIVANPTTITGSIGVIISYLNFEDLAKKYGVSNVVYKSGEHKDILNSFRKATDSENGIMQTLVDDAYDVFVNRVATGRKMELDKVKQLADGRVYSAKGAKENGLIDQTGNFEDAVSEARKLAKIETASVVEFGKEGFLEILLGSTLHLGRSWLPFSASGAKILYLYSTAL